MKTADTACSVGYFDQFHGTCLDPVFEAMLSYGDAREDFEDASRDQDDYSDDVLAHIIEVMDAAYNRLRHLKTTTCTPISV